MKDSISVVVPTYNCEQYLGVSVKSIIDQSISADEILIVDDGSTDHTKAVVDELITQNPDAGIKYIYQENKGPAAARNKGVEEAQGSWIAFLDADDKWFPFKLKLQIEYLQKHNDCFLVSTTMSYDKEELTEEPDTKSVKSKEYRFKDLLINNFIGISSTVLVKRKLFLKAGGFSERLKLCEDHDLWLRLAGYGNLHKIYYPTAYYRVRQEGLSSGNKEATHKGKIAFLNEMYDQDYSAYRWRFKCKALSYNKFDISVSYAERKDYKNALKHLFQSFLYFPFYFPVRTEFKMLRIKRLCVLLLQIWGIKKD